MTLEEGMQIVQIYKTRENGVDFCLKIMKMVGADKQDEKVVDAPKSKVKARRICPKCGKPISGRGNKNVCDECKALVEKSTSSAEDDLKNTAKELAEMV